MSAEADKTKALEDIQRQNETSLKAKLDAAEIAKQQHMQEMEAKLAEEKAKQERSNKLQAERQ